MYSFPKGFLAAFLLLLTELNSRLFVHCFAVSNSYRMLSMRKSIQNKHRSVIPLMATSTNTNGSSRSSSNEETPNKTGHRRSNHRPTSSILQRRKREWIHQSLTFYATVSREAKRKEKGQHVPSQIQLEQHKSNFITANKLYFARLKIKKNQPRHAECIYRKLIDDLVQEQEDEQSSCDHAQIAISTLLLSLLLQRQGQIKETRSTFNRFFRLITTTNDDGELKECTCSAKVLQAYALFEMKQNNPKKAYDLARMAVEMDNELKPVLQWKQFRDAKKLVGK